MPHFAKNINSAPVWLFSSLLSPPNLPKLSPSPWTPGDRGTAVPCTEGKLKHSVTNCGAEGTSQDCNCTSALQGNASSPRGLPTLGLSQPEAFLPASALGAGSGCCRLDLLAEFWGCAESPATCVTPGHPHFLNQPFQGCLPCPVGANPWPFHCSVWPPSQLITSTSTCRHPMTSHTPAVEGSHPHCPGCAGICDVQQDRIVAVFPRDALCPGVLLLPLPLQPRGLRHALGRDGQSQRLNKEL